MQGSGEVPVNDAAGGVFRLNCHKFAAEGKKPQQPNELIAGEYDHLASYCVFIDERTEHPQAVGFAAPRCGFPQAVCQWRVLAGRVERIKSIRPIKICRRRDGSREQGIPARLLVADSRS